MNKLEITKYANNIIDSLVKICSFETRQDIILEVYLNQKQEYPIQNCQNQEYQNHNFVETYGNVETWTSHGLYIIRLYTTIDSTKKQIMDVITHQLGHIFTIQFRAFYNIFIDKKEQKSIPFKAFERENEKIAKRYSLFLKHILKEKIDNG